MIFHKKICPLVALYGIQVSHGSSKHKAARGVEVGVGRVDFFLYILIENLKTSSCQNLTDRFQYNSSEMFRR